MLLECKSFHSSIQLYGMQLDLPSVFAVYSGLWPGSVPRENSTNRPVVPLPSGTASTYSFNPTASSRQLHKQFTNISKQENKQFNGAALFYSSEIWGSPDHCHCLWQIFFLPLVLFASFTSKIGSELFANVTSCHTDSEKLDAICLPINGKIKSWGAFIDKMWESTWQKLWLRTRTLITQLSWTAQEGQN